MDLHGPKFKTGEQLPGRVVEDLLAMSQVRVTGGQPMSLLPQGQIVHQDPRPEFTNRNSDLTRATFLAQIQFAGPQDEADFTDSRYWVREIGNATEDGTPLGERLHFKLDINEGVDPIEDLVEAPVLRWIPAHNLAEMVPRDPGSETHALGLSEDTDDGAIIHVSHSLSPDGTPRFFFNRPAGSSVRPCIIASGPVPPDAKMLTVRWVRSRIIGSTFADEAFGDTEEVLMWWNQRGRHFRGFETGGHIGLLHAHHNVLPAYQVDGLWRVMQVFRATTLWPLPIVAASDCQPHGSSA